MMTFQSPESLEVARVGNDSGYDERFVVDHFVQRILCYIFYTSKLYS